MPLKIVRNDITKMNTEAIVNTACARPAVGTGCDSAVYQAAGYEELLEYRKEKIGFVPEGEAFLTPGFHLQARYIIHAVSPRYTGGGQGEEERLRACYRNSLRIAKEHHIRSIAFPLISTGSFGYPKEEGMRIAADEINAFLLRNEMLVCLVVFDSKAAALGAKICPDLEAYIDHNYVRGRQQEEYGNPHLEPATRKDAGYRPHLSNEELIRQRAGQNIQAQRSAQTDPDADTMPVSSAMPPVSAGPKAFKVSKEPKAFKVPKASPAGSLFKRKEKKPNLSPQVEVPEKDSVYECDAVPFPDFGEQHENRLEERMEHLSDTFSQYLMYLIQDKKMENAEVWKRAIIDKKVFSKIKNNPYYHPQKLTALCLCVGAKLNLDESRDLLARAGYALSPCDKTDIIFSYFIENEIYDMIELDIQLEEHGLPCIIS